VELIAQVDAETWLLANETLVNGLMWGKPRHGHDEGEVWKHIRHIWNNIDRLSYKALIVDTVPGESGMTNVAAAARGSETWQRLRLIALVHDSFKYQVDASQSKSGENHHAMRARRWAEQYYPHLFDAQMLDVLELHDEAYNSWQKGNRDGKWERAKERAVALHNRLSQAGALELFNMFFTCDTHIGDDQRLDWEWWKTYCRSNNAVYEYFIA